MEKSVYFSLGSNIEPRVKYLKEALFMLDKYFKREAVSSLYETEPVGDKEQGNFFNICAEYSAGDISPYDLLKIVNDIEDELGRIRDISRPKGPRVIDIDILIFSDYSIESDFLTIPHKSMFERNFVLIPLLEIADKITAEKYSIYDCIKNNPSLFVGKVENISFD